jgi:hypothetical protein
MQSVVLTSCCATLEDVHAVMGTSDCEMTEESHFIYFKVITQFNDYRKIAAIHSITVCDCCSRDIVVMTIEQLRLQ